MSDWIYWPVLASLFAAGYYLTGWFLRKFVGRWVVVVIRNKDGGKISKRVFVRPRSKVDKLISEVE